VEAVLKLQTELVALVRQVRDLLVEMARENLGHLKFLEVVAVALG
jgi:hypothetical protein